GLFGGSATPATFTGNGTGENIVGGAGNDTLSGGGGADVIRGGAGDDLITIGDATFFRIDAGNGQDTLLVAGFDLDLTAISNLALKDMETINMAGVGNNTLTLSISDLLDLDGSPNAALAASGFVGDLSHNSLVVMGLAGDAVDLAASGAGDVGEGGAWTLAGSTTIGANTYDVYNFLDGAALLGTIAVDDDMSVTIV
ncbi:MAG: hypothetical protein NW205_03435, partial [Hyphomicrobiaceae bacterium]|nr:hypothetical protein [Hyphomicrobiaceae bacterium]